MLKDRFTRPQSLQITQIGAGRLDEVEAKTRRGNVVKRLIEAGFIDCKEALDENPLWLTGLKLSPKYRHLEAIDDHINWIYNVGEQIAYHENGIQMLQDEQKALGEKLCQLRMEWLGLDDPPEAA